MRMCQMTVMIVPDAHYFVFVEPNSYDGVIDGDDIDF
jgi:hypothetical protein